MRYYMYLDKEFLKRLFSTITTVDFDINVFEFTVTNSTTTNNNFALNPGVENMFRNENFCDEKKEEEKLNEGCKDEKGNRKKVDMSYGSSTSYNTQTQKKYLNIEDITEIKNNNFYHTLLDKVNQNLTREENSDRIYNLCGYIKVSRYRDDSSVENIKKNNSFFMIDDTFIWYEKDMLQGDIDLLSEMECKVNVIGYMMNSRELRDDKKILKAIAIYIE